MFPKRNRYIFSYQKKRKAAAIKRVITIILTILGILLALLIAFIIYNSKIHIDLTKDRDIEVNTPAKASQFIEEIGNGDLVEDVDIDTTQIGTKECNVKIKVGEDIRDYSFNVNVVDTIAPVISGVEGELSLLEGTPVETIAKAEATDNSGEEIAVRVEGDYNPNKAGTQALTLVAEDSSGNKAEQSLAVNVIGITEDMPDSTFITRTGHKGEIKDGILYVDGVMLVNKSFGLPSDFGGGMDGATMEAYYKLATAGWNAGMDIVTVTEYRSYREQELLYEYWSEVAGEGPDTKSAVKAGHSEHQTGLAMDINSTDRSFAETAEAKWLSDHCAEYGFILRYPENKEDSTGCSWEPFHIRYVGTDLAGKLYNKGDWITMEEYFGVPSEYLN